MSTNIKEVVQEKYGATARRVAAGESGASCCGSSACCDTADPITSNLYDEAQKQGLPEKAVLAAMTGYGQEEDRARARAAGFDHHLTKPVDFARLSQILAEVPDA